MTLAHTIAWLAVGLLYGVVGVGTTVLIDNCMSERGQSDETIAVVLLWPLVLVMVCFFAALTGTMYLARVFLWLGRWIGEAFVRS